MKTAYLKIRMALMVLIALTALSGCGGSGEERGTNHPPVALSQSGTTAEDHPIDLRLQGNDEDNDTLTYTITTQPTHGTLSGTPPAIRYTPNADYHGGDRLMFKVNDGHADSAEAMVYIEITSDNDAPMARDDTYEAKRRGEDHLWNVKSNDTDPDGDVITLASIGTPDHGTASDAGDELIRYTPPNDFSGTDRFAYSVQDPSGAANSATVLVKVDKNWDNDGTILNQINDDIWGWAIAQNTSGDAAAVWIKKSGTHRHVFGSCFDHSAKQWTAPVQLDTANSNANNPAVAINDSGQMFAAWNQPDNNNHQQIFVIKRNAPTCNGTNAPNMITNGSNDSTLPQISIDNDGAALAVWTTGSTTLYGAYYAPDSDSWFPVPNPINSNVTATFDLSVDRDGNGFVVWRENGSGSKLDIFGRFYKKSDHSWTAAQQIDDASVDAGIPDAALNADGKGWVVYPQGNTVYARRIDAAALSMDAASVHIADADTAANAHVGIDAAGDAMAIWTQNDSGKTNLYALHCKSSTGWETAATRLEKNDAHPVEYPQLSVSANADAAVVWLNHGSVYANRYRADKKEWQSEESLIEQQNDSARYPKIVSDGDGSFTALWDARSIGDTLYYNRFW